MTRRTCAVVGAGLSGLACARALAEHDVGVVVFDKGRSAGGRITTRRVEAHAFDLGAQYFTARTALFTAEVQRWRDADLCAPWNGRIVALDAVDEKGLPIGARRPTPWIERLVGTPGMSALARHLGKTVDVRTSHRVESIARRDGKLELHGTVAPTGTTLGPLRDDARGGGELGAYDAVVACLPAPQAARLLHGVAPALAEQAEAVAFDPCFAVGFAASSRDRAALEALDFDGAFIGRRADGELEPNGAEASSPLGWVARDSSKPGRPPGERWVLHATEAWSREALDRPEAEVAPALIQAFCSAFGLGELESDVTFVRRWAFARARSALSCGALFDDRACVGAGGDWASGGRVEGAFLSGLDLAQRVLDALGARRSEGERGTQAPRP